MKRIAVILSQFEESCQSLIWNGIEEAAKKEDVELVSFPALSEDEIISHYPLIADFVEAGNFDCVILFTGAMSEYTAWPVVYKYAQGFTIPVISIAGAVDTCTSSILINNQRGIIEQINHLVNKHNKQKIAFIKGPSSNEEANERFAAYLEGLHANHLTFNDQLIFEGDFSEEGGIQAIKKMVEDELDIDAFVCCDDFTAIGAIQELKKHGIFPPDKISVIGFDDIDEAVMTSPELSTVHQPFYELGVSALEAAISALPNKQIVKNTSAVYRNSCGCVPDKIKVFREHARKIEQEELYAEKESFIESMTPLIEYTVNNTDFRNIYLREKHAFFLYDSLNSTCSLFFDCITNKESEPRFLKELIRVISKSEEFDGDLALWKHLFIQILPIALKDKNRQNLLRLNRLLQEARIIVDNHQTAVAKRKTYERHLEEEMIRESCQKIITCHNTEHLFKIIVDELLRLGIDECAIALFNNYSPISYLDWSFPEDSIIRGMASKGTYVTLDEEGIHFETKQVLPLVDSAEISHKSLIFLPLYFYGEYFGYLIVNYQKGAIKEMYEELRLHVSSAIKSCFMMDKLRALSMNDELTGISNRRGFMLLTQELLARSMTTGKELILYYFDMDNLKMINDNFGHDEGDRALKASTSIIQRTFRSNDITGRIGGDEFVVIIERSSEGVEETISERLCKTMEIYNTHSKLPYKIELSFAYTVFKATNEISFMDILNQTDRKMFEEKKRRKKGRDFTPPQ